MNYQTFSNLQFRPLPKNSFHSFHNDLRDTSSEKDLLYLSENCHDPELVGEPLRLELNFTFPQEHVTVLIVLGERMSSVAVDSFGVIGKTI